MEPNEKRDEALIYAINTNRELCFENMLRSEIRYGGTISYHDFFYQVTVIIPIVDNIDRIFMNFNKMSLLMNINSLLCVGGKIDIKII